MKRIGLAVALALLALPPAGQVAQAAPGSPCAAAEFLPAPILGYKGTTTGGSFYAQTGQSVSADVESKIVLRVTGQGPLNLTAIGPDGQSITPKDLVAHTAGSSWDGIVPGDEWGSFWVFPTPGCWDLHAVRGAVVGDVYVDTDAPAFTAVTFKLASPRRSIHSGQKVTFSVHPEIVPGPVEAGLAGRITIRRAGKTVRVLTLKVAGLQTYRPATRLTVQRPTSFTARARVSFNGTTMSKTLRFRVLPASGS